MKAEYRGAGVYVFRTRRPGLIGRIPPWLPWAAGGISALCLLALHLPWMFSLLSLLLLPRHFAYVGETTAMVLRRDQHIHGGGKYSSVRKPWSDLEPKHYSLRLPRAPKWVLLKVETLFIVLLWPVYNDQKNRWNPRRIPLSSAKLQRAMREKIGWSFNLRFAHLLLLVAIAAYLLSQEVTP